MASIYRRSGTWWISYYISGKHVRQSLRTSNKRAAERQKQAIEAKLLDPFLELPATESPTAERFWDEYLAWAYEHKRSSAVQRTVVFWNQLMKHTKVGRVSELTSVSVESFKRWRKSEGNSEQTINNGLREIRSVFNRCKKLKVYNGPNPVDDGERYSVPWRAPEYFTLEQMEQLLECARGRGRDVVWTVLLCGCRFLSDRPPVPKEARPPLRVLPPR